MAISCLAAGFPLFFPFPFLPRVRTPFVTTMIPNSFKFECPSCGQHISAMMPDAGTAGACPTCGSHFVVPSPTPLSESSGARTAGPQRNRLVAPIVAGATVLVMALAALALYTSGRFATRKIQSLSVPSPGVDATTPAAATAQTSHAAPTDVTPPITPVLAPAANAPAAATAQTAPATPAVVAPLITPAPATASTVQSRFSGTWKGQIDPGTGELSGALVEYIIYPPEKKWTHIEVSYPQNVQPPTNLSGITVDGAPFLAGDTLIVVPIPNPRSG